MKMSVFCFIPISILFLSNEIYACEISINPEKEQYSLGETATLSVELQDTHRNCTFTGKEPKVQTSGLEMLAKTKYKEKSAGLWNIKYKVKILEAKNQFTVLRDNCSNGGGVKTISLKISNNDNKP